MTAASISISTFARDHRQNISIVRVFIKDCEYKPREMSMHELEYGPVFVFGGKHKGRVLYYDDDATEKTAICYIGHPLSFLGTYDIQLKLLREPTLGDLLNRKEEIDKVLTDIALYGRWDVDARSLHSLWAEKSMIEDSLFERRMFGEFGQLDGSKEVFLCHASADKGWVRMVHDDLMHVGVKCWLDENKIRVGDSIVSKISSGLASSQTMIAFLSRKSVDSMWALKEWQSFLARQLSGTDIKILPALLEKCDIPPILADIKYADFTKSYHDGYKEIYNALK
ncbi:TIR domain-containing protein [Tardiphaga sp. OK246]|jgi:hypothetical protein|uniref:toll/interleukin-1 receptor domain-containing protein n=1 Tax=Tardiphaga sp. OK246 TaxID=1855307 RepID=UPI000B6F81AF|nr:toll/interleukin-1 receptor domain-containing protein [Tardiphaga sp. OK246]SNS95982.1 TIR domain-containing protein [Tardiphaga sp. OK246]